MQTEDRTSSAAASAANDFASLVDEAPDVLEARLRRIAGQGTLPDASIARLGEALVRRYQPAPDAAGRRAEPGAALTPAAAEALAAIYSKAGAGSETRQHLLRALAADGRAAALRVWVRLLTADPPPRSEHCDLALIPLFQLPEAELSAVFPEVLAGLSHPQLAAGLIDLCNFVAREGRWPEHPARARVDELASLFGDLTQRLLDVEARPNDFADDPAGLGRLVSDCVALLIGLADALALIGDRRSAGKLRQALGLGHRRVRAEAAAALARLGDDEGIEALIELAAEPAVRRRVLKYLEEVGAMEKVDPELRSDEALAAADLAAWLAHPRRLGAAPHELELVHRRRQFWPGLSQPTVCYLFRYYYRFPARQISGIGIAGPVVDALAADLEDVAPQDIYALYAGWNTEHPEIAQVEAESASSEVQTLIDEQVESLEAAGYESIRPLICGHFLGENLLLAEALADGQAGLTIEAADGAHWFAGQTALGRLSPEFLYAMFKGRRLLAAFNPARDDSDAEDEANASGAADVGEADSGDNDADADGRRLPP